jgi:hypothetical protein
LAIREGEGNGPKFTAMIAEAKEVLSSDPNLQKKNPRCFIPYIRLYVAQENKAEVLKLLATTNKAWPTYFCTDTWARKFLSTMWMGTPKENWNYIVKRADTLGGAQGDKFFARIAWHVYDNVESPERYFGKNGKYKWPRIQRGFKQIFKEFPNDPEARIAFITLALVSDEEDAAKHTFDDLPPNKK